MKKILLGFYISLLLLTSTALADITISTEHFEVDLPDSWTCFDENTYFNDHEIMNFTEVPYYGLSGLAMDKNPKVITGVFGELFIKEMPSYSGDLHNEPLTIDEKESALYTFNSKSGDKKEYAALVWEDGVLGYLHYINLKADDAKDNFRTIAVTLRQKGHPAPARPESTAPTPDSGVINAEDKGPWTLYDDHGITVTLENVRIAYANYLGADMTVINNSDEEVYVMVDDVYINGWKVSGTNGPEVKGGKKGKDTILWIDSERAADIKDFSDLKELSFIVEIINPDSFSTIYTSDEIIMNFNSK